MRSFVISRGASFVREMIGEETSHTPLTAIKSILDTAQVVSTYPTPSVKENSISVTRISPMRSPIRLMEDLSMSGTVISR